MGDPKAPPLQIAELFRVLDTHHVVYVIVGGLAATVQGSGRVTFDVDVVPEWSDENLARLALALKASDARLRVTGAPAPVDYALDAASLRGFEVSTWRTRFGDLDVIIGTPTKDKGRLAGYADLIERAHRREAFGIVVWVADLGDVIESKQALSRVPDLAALPELRRLKEHLDRTDPS